MSWACGAGRGPMELVARARPLHVLPVALGAGRRVGRSGAAGRAGRSGGRAPVVPRPSPAARARGAGGVCGRGAARAGLKRDAASVAAAVGIDVEVAPRAAPVSRRHAGASSGGPSGSEDDAEGEVAEEEDSGGGGGELGAVLLLNALAFLYGTNTSAVKALEASDVSSSLTCTIRFALAAAVAVVPLAISSVSRKPVPAKYRRTYEPKLWASGAELALYLFGGYAAQTVGLETGNASTISFLFAVTVILVPLLEGLAGEPVPRVVWGSTGLAALGVCLLELGAAPGGGAPAFSAGDAWGLLGSIFFALHMVRSKPIGDRHDTSALAVAQMSCVAALSALWLAVDKLPPLRQQPGLSAPGLSVSYASSAKVARAWEALGADAAGLWRDALARAPWGDVLPYLPASVRQMLLQVPGLPLSVRLEYQQTFGQAIGVDLRSLGLDLQSLGLTDVFASTPMQPVLRRIESDADQLALGLAAAGHDVFGGLVASTVALPWAQLLYTGIVSTGLCQLLELFALKRVRPSTASLIYATIPVWGAGIAVFTLGEELTPMSVAGAALIVLSSGLPVLLKSDEETEPDEDVIDA